MAFFDVPSDDQIPAESARLLDEYRRATGGAQAPDGHRAYGRLPHIVETRVVAAKNLIERSSLPRDLIFVAGMLISHARRCHGCFRASRLQLGQVGYDEATLDAMCANPEALPLDLRGRRIIHWALRFANSTPDLTPKDFREMADDGFSREEVQEIIALAVFWVQNTMFNTAARVALTDDG
jgi:hypothetical protein